MLADDLLPIYDTSDSLAVVVDAPLHATWDALMDVDLMKVGCQKPLAAVLGALRMAPELVVRLMHGERPDPPPERMTLLDTTRTGMGASAWSLLAERPPRDLALGLVGKFWKPVIEFADVAAEEFVAFDEPGYAKTIYAFHLRPLGDGAIAV